MYLRLREVCQRLAKPVLTPSVRPEGKAFGAKDARKQRILHGLHLGLHRECPLPGVELMVIVMMIMMMMPSSAKKTKASARKPKVAATTGSFPWPWQGERGAGVSKLRDYLVEF